MNVAAFIAKGMARRWAAMAATAAAALILIAGAATLRTEQLTLTTFYPSPYGVYQNLRATKDAYFAYGGGSVGVGTTNPQAKLHIEGSLRQTGNAFLGGPVGIGTPTPEANLEVAGTFRATQDTLLAIEDSRGSRFRRGRGQSRVGIGTTTPATKLEVAGDIIFQLDGVRLRPMWVNGNEDTSTWAGNFGRRTGYSDSCNGSWARYTCQASESRNCFDIESNGRGGSYWNVSCRRAVAFVEF